MKTALEQARETFLAQGERNRSNAVQRVALQIMAGIDIDWLMQASGVEQQQAARRLTRLIERERLKGANGHWSYDLNRHIALKQALDRLEGKDTREVPRTARGTRKDYGQKKRIQATASKGHHRQWPMLHETTNAISQR